MSGPALQPRSLVIGALAAGVFAIGGVSAAAIAAHHGTPGPGSPQGTAGSSQTAAQGDSVSSQMGTSPAGASPPAAGGAASGGAAPQAKHGLRILDDELLGPTGDLGPSGRIGLAAFTEAPDGSVYYSHGATVIHDCPSGTGNCVSATTAVSGGPVDALAATMTDLFVSTGRTVTEYSEPAGQPVRHWTLSSLSGPASAGLLISGGTLWAWTDWATDQSGFEFATLDRISMNRPGVHIVSKNAYPGDMAADASGLYFEAVQHEVNDVLGHALPSGRVVYRADKDLDAPLALPGGRVVILASGADGNVLRSFSATTLAPLSSAPVAATDRGIAATTRGLIVLDQPCSGESCAAATVSELNAATGAATGAVAVRHAALLLAGPAPDLITIVHSEYHLVRIVPVP